MNWVRNPSSFVQAVGERIGPMAFVSGCYSSPHANIIAGAGTGKTTTLVEIARVAAGTIIISSFNNAIIREVSARLASMGIPPNRAEAKTMHSVGLGAWRTFRNNRIPQTDQFKCGNLLSAICNDDFEARRLVRRTGRKAVISLVSFAKQHGFGVKGSVAPEYNDLAAWVTLCQSYGLDEELKNGTAEDVSRLAIMLFTASKDALADAIDFDDQMWAPLFHNAPYKRYDWVLLDEAQDTNPIRRMQAERLLRPNTGRIVACGDPFQAINRFAGADSNALDLIKEKFNSIELPLSVTMRCPKAVVEEVKKHNPDVPLECHPGAPEGSVTSIQYNDRGNMTPYLDFAEFTVSDVVLCRNTRPLVELFFRIIDSEDHIPVRIEGSSPAQAYVALIESMDSGTLQGLMTDLDAYMKQQDAKWMERNPEKLERIADKVATIKTMAARCIRMGQKSINALTSMISRLFGDEFTEKRNSAEPKLTLSTIHKAKGKEWNRVYILGMNLFQPSKYATKPEDLRQEKNLIYVAQTRTKDALVYLVCCPDDFGVGIPVDQQMEKVEAPLLDGEGGFGEPPQALERSIDDDLRNED